MQGLGLVFSIIRLIFVLIHVVICSAFLRMILKSFDLGSLRLYFGLELCNPLDPFGGEDSFVCVGLHAFSGDHLGARCVYCIDCVCFEFEL